MLCFENTEVFYEGHNSLPVVLLHDFSVCSFTGGHRGAQGCLFHSILPPLAGRYDASWPWTWRLSFGAFLPLNFRCPYHEGLNSAR